MKIKKHIGKLYLIVAIVAFIWGHLYINANIQNESAFNEMACGIVNAFSFFNISLGVIWAITEVLFNRK